jgi:hypothetical protein
MAADGRGWPQMAAGEFGGCGKGSAVSCAPPSCRMCGFAALGLYDYSVICFYGFF